MRTPDETLIKALYILAEDIQTEDGVASMCITESALRITELVDGVRKVLMNNLHLADGDDCTLFELKRLINFVLPEE